jgi:hypothetical protein
MSGEGSPMELTRFVELLRASSSTVHIRRGRTKKIARGFYSLLLLWMRSSRLAFNAGKVETVLGSIPVSTDTVESEGRQLEQF